MVSIKSFRSVLLIKILLLHQQGNPRPQKKLPEKVPFFTENVPPTTAKQFGSRLQNPNAREILRLEMSTCYKKRKSDLGNYYS
jgi:abhydrolase domain-containing protein 1/3